MYMLIRELSQGRIVGIAHRDNVFLFTGQGVFICWKFDGFELPRNRDKKQSSFWLFLDVGDYSTPPPALYTGYSVFPIHLVSYGREQCKILEKVRLTVSVDIKMWSNEEIKAGYA